MHNLGFIGICLVAMSSLRKLGWSMCKAFMYGTSTLFCLLVLVIWGVGIAFAFHFLVRWLYPGWIAKIFGFAVASYVSVINHGLLNEQSIPPDKKDRHAMITSASLGAFLGLSLVLAFIP